MKKLIFLLVVMATCTQLLAQTKKYAALATDRRNYYGGDFGYVTDMPSLAEAEKKALEACKAAGGTNCRVVLSFSGAGWGAYRTYDALKGDGFGWGGSKNQKGSRCHGAGNDAGNKDARRHARNQLLFHQHH